MVRTYIWRQQANVAQWVALHPLFEVCERETGYEGGGRRREAWWRQEASEKQLWATLADSRETKRMSNSGEIVTK